MVMENADVHKAQQSVRTGLERIRGEMAALARRALDPPTDVELAQAWLERADIVSRLAESIPVGDEQVEALDWRLRQRRGR